MSRLVSLVLLNSMTTFAITYFYNTYIIKFWKTSTQDAQHKKLDYLYKKIQELEQSVNFLQQSIEEIDYKIEQKNNKIIESNIELNSKLEDFITSNYELYD